MRIRTVLGGAAALVMCALPAGAQETGWTAWQGCWQQAGDEAPTGQVVCIAPAVEAKAVRVVTLQDGAVAGETIIRADGVARPVDEGGCRGTETASFSADGRRVYTRAELDCEGVRRVSTGVLAMITELEWLDAQAVGVGEQHATRVVRYRPAPVPVVMQGAISEERSMAVSAARLHAAAPLAVDHVAEASRVLAQPVVAALLAARQHGYDLSPRTLVQLRDVGVPAQTIDVMIALSYPEKFRVREPAPRTGDTDIGYPRGRTAFAGECYDPYRTTRRYSDDCYDRYGYGYRYDRYRRSAYSPWGYDPYGWRHDNPVVVVVEPVDANENNGEVVKGRGYTRTTGATGNATPRAGSGRSRESSPAATRASSGSTERTTRTTTGSSSGSGSTGRTAKPRGGG